MNRERLQHWRKLTRWAALPCRDASWLISRSMDAPLPWTEKAALQTHLWICRVCRRYRHQLLEIRAALRHWEESPWASRWREIPDEAKSRMRAALRREAERGED